MKQVMLTSDVGRQPFGDVVRGLEPGEVEVLDSNGQVVALLTRVPEADASVYAAIAKAAATDAEELRRRQREAVTGATTSEVLSRLLALPSEAIPKKTTKKMTVELVSEGQVVLTSEVVDPMIARRPPKN